MFGDLLGIAHRPFPGLREAGSLLAHGAHRRLGDLQMPHFRATRLLLGSREIDAQGLVLRAQLLQFFVQRVIAAGVDFQLCLQVSLELGDFLFVFLAFFFGEKLGGERALPCERRWQETDDQPEHEWFGKKIFEKVHEHYRQAWRGESVREFFPSVQHDRIGQARFSNEATRAGILLGKNRFPFMVFCMSHCKTLATLFWSCLMAGMPAIAHPVPESPQWLTYPGGEGPGKGKHIVLITADQEYRSEQSLPMLAGILSKHHGFDCTVLFGVNDKGLVDPTMPVYPEKGKESEFKPHHIPGLEHLAKADLLIFCARLLTLSDEELKHWVAYFDSGKPIIGLRTANHAFRSPLPYERDGKRVNIGDILGGSFMSHHGNWQADSTRGDLVPDQKNHPILTGVKDIWGLTDVYRTYKEGEGLPAGCTALVMGQPLIGREQGGKDNPEKEPLPVVWVKDWKTNSGKTARVLQSTMGSAKDFENPGLRRLIVNAAYWGLGLEEKISAESRIEPTSPYKPLSSGFNYEKLGVTPQAPATYR